VVLSKRERYVAIGVLAAVGIFGLNYFFVDPLLASRSELDKKIAEKTDEARKEKKLIDESRNKATTWASMQNNGLRRKDASEAEAPVLSSIRDWAQDAGMVLSAVKPERSEKEKDFQKLTFRATGSGRMSQIAWFLWRIQTSPIPVKVSDLQLSAHKEGTDELTLQIGISTACLLPDADKDKSAFSPAREVAP
jgi:Tfp pilus assembly protein PilO